MTTARNLTRDAAAERAGQIAVAAYDIALDLTSATDEVFRCASTVEFTATEPGSDVVIDVAAVELVEVTLNGAPVATDGYDPEHGLLVRGLAATNTLTVVADFPYTALARGMVRTVDPADGEIYLYTSFEPAAAQRVFACFDQPDLKATFTFHVRIPVAWVAVSNMPEAGRDPGADDTTTVHFDPTPRMSTYLAVVCAGPYARVRSDAGGRDQSIYCRPSMVEHLDADEIFDLTRRGMDFFEKQFGQPYPLPKYDHVATPGYPGAMENFGCITFGERFLIFRSTPTTEQLVTRGVVVLHELAHMWFGDLVTMRWWDDLWLNEAFATWAAYWAAAEATDYPEPWSVFALDVKRLGLEADQLSTTHPVVADIVDVHATETNFDAITYRKGASVLKQLAAYVGIDTFTTALRSYFAERAWANASFADLVSAIVAASGRPIADFVTQWLGTTQANTLRPLVELAADGTYSEVVVAQEAPAGHPTLRTHRIGVGLYDLDGDRLVRREQLDVEVSGARTVLTALRGQPAADLVLLNDDDLTYAKVRLDERSLSTLLGHIQGLPAALPRAICWLSAVDMVSDAELRTRDFVALVVNGLAGETVASLVSSVLDAAERALSLYADPAWAPQGWDALAGLERSACYDTEPGSPLQLTWVRAYAAAARSGEHLELVGRWYAGQDLPPGVRLDADLRWLLLQTLVARGVAGPAEIDAEAAGDASVSGARQAAVTRALVATPEGKRAAWEMITQDTDTALETRLHAAHAYGYADHAALVPTHVADYLSILDVLWDEQGAEVGRLLARLAFPRGQVSEETLAAIAAWEAEEHPPSIVRGVAEGRDQLAQSLRARARDRSGS